MKCIFVHFELLCAQFLWIWWSCSFPFFGEMALDKISAKVSMVSQWRGVTILQKVSASSFPPA